MTRPQSPTDGQINRGQPESAGKPPPECAAPTGNGSDSVTSERRRSSAVTTAAEHSTRTSALVEFHFNGQRVRSVVKNGEPWFVASDVCGVLAHSNSCMALLEDDEKGVSNLYTPGGEQQVNIVNESGLFALIFTCRKPEARAFRRWVTGEVLPSIRKAGRYEAVPATNGTVQVALPNLGRYVITLGPGRSRHIHNIGFEALKQESTATDVQVLALALKTIHAFWYKIEQMRSIEYDPTDGFHIERLGRAIRDGSGLAGQYLGFYDWKERTDRTPAQ